MTTLITGGTGFVGRNLTNRFVKDNRNFVSVGSKDYDLRKQQHVEYLLSDHKPQTIVHLAAAVGGIGANQKNPAKFMFDNLAMGMNLIDGAFRHGSCRKFIMLGTVCSYPCITPTPFKESDLWNGYPEVTNAPYGIAKKTLAEMGFAYRKQYNFEFVNLVPTNLYGPYDNFDDKSSHVIPALIKKVWQAKKEGKPLEVWGTGQASREFLYVEDLCSAIGAAIDDIIPSEPINIGSGEEIKICDLVTLICKKLDFRGKIIYNSDKPDGQPRRLVDFSKAKYYLKYNPSVNLDEGLDRTIQYAKHHIFKE